MSAGIRAVRVVILLLTARPIGAGSPRFTHLQVAGPLAPRAGVCQPEARL
jgi:hypothetical protein